MKREDNLVMIFRNEYDELLLKAKAFNEIEKIVNYVGKYAYKYYDGMEQVADIREIIKQALEVEE